MTIERVEDRFGTTPKRLIGDTACGTAAMLNWIVEAKQIEYESSREVARAVAKTAAYKQSRKDRKKVEMLFAHLKRILKLDRLRLRGLSGAHDESYWQQQRRIYVEW